MVLFDTKVETVQLTLSLYLVGLAISQLLHALLRLTLFSRDTSECQTVPHR